MFDFYQILRRSVTTVLANHLLSFRQELVTYSGKFDCTFQKASAAKKMYPIYTNLIEPNCFAITNQKNVSRREV